MGEKRFIAVDLGAESGRVVVATLQEGHLSLEEIHRFLNGPVEVRGTLYWDVLALYRNVLEGLRIYCDRYGDTVEGIGVDTWGVDFGLLAADGSLLQNPVCYRDHRTDDVPDVVRARIPEQKLYEHVGIFLLPIYTLCQMVALREADSPILANADGFLMMPGVISYFLSGRRFCERSNAITTQLYNPREDRWDPEIFKLLDLPIDIMPELVDAGTILGELLDGVKAETGLKGAPVIAPCTHDTGSAVAAVPGRGEDWAFLSSGTWSILGSLSDGVVTTPEALAAGLSNELTMHSFFLCRNIMGLWLLQQARASWTRGGREYSYPELVALAETATAGGPLVDPNDGSFMAPDDMPEAIRSYCRRTGQPEPDGVPETVRCILESLALCYGNSLKKIGNMLGRSYSTLHIVGGGSQNTLLSQFAASATGLTVLTGPVEATVAGNVMAQVLARGYVDSVEEAREVVRASTDMVEYAPQDESYWRDRYGIYLGLLES
jgi:rhamnulokinase